MKVPVENLVGEEGNGLDYILTSMNSERVLIASECIGDGRQFSRVRCSVLTHLSLAKGRYFIDKAKAYACERRVFGRPIGQNQGVQFPIAQAYAAVESASLMVERAASLYDSGQPCGKEANMAKLLAGTRVRW